MKITEINDSIRPNIRDFFTTNWGSAIMVSRGKSHRIDELPGFVAMEANHLLGLITYNIEDEECEIVSLDSLVKNQGVGSRLLECVVKMAEEKRSRRVWLITSNDNLHAMRFYQKRGFNMVALYVNAINAARKIKPEIPKFGNDGIPLRHEIEFELNLSESSADGQEFHVSHC
ncbi:MAG TPA: GNAT family N-acetyltransferase [Bacillales bacterium]|nr:GNAT family N-acetyltransferase [Bacillales bacterium]